MQMQRRRRPAEGRWESGKVMEGRSFDHLRFADAAKAV